MNELLLYFKKLVSPRNKLSVEKPKPQISDQFSHSLDTLIKTVDVNKIVSDNVYKRTLIRVYHIDIHELVTSVCLKSEDRKDHRVNAVSLDRFFRADVSTSECLQRLVNGVRSASGLNAKSQHDISVIIGALSENK